MEQSKSIPRAFFWRRIHSIAGLWLVIFLFEHILTNSQAALMFGEDGEGFIRAVNLLQSLPYLHVIEITLLAIPFGIHIFFGIKYLYTGETNSFCSDGTKPALSGYFNNHAYTFQRITSWILIFTLLAHVIHLRVFEYPEHAQIESHNYYMLPVSVDDGLYTLSNRLGVELWDKSRIEKAKESILLSDGSFVDREVREQVFQQKKDFISALQKRDLDKTQVVAVASSFGAIELLALRDSFKNIFLMLLYSIFVLAAAFHAFNGLWTFCITWGLTLTEKSQKMMRAFTTLLMVLVAFGGLFAIWATYWINLKS